MCPANLASHHYLTRIDYLDIARGCHPLCRPAKAKAAKPSTAPAKPKAQLEAKELVHESWLTDNGKIELHVTVQTLIACGV